MMSVNNNQKKQLLLVDDEPAVLRCNQRFIQRVFNDVTVLSSESGNSAIRKLKEGLQPRAIVSDIAMPNGTGMDLWEFINSYMPDLRRKVLFVTGGGNGSEKLRRFIEKMKYENRLIEKPFDLDDFRSRVENLIDEESQGKSGESDNKPVVKSDNTSLEEKEEEMDLAEWIGHKINNPLAVVNHNAEELQTAFKKNRDQLTVDDWRTVNQMVKGSKQLADAIKEITQRINDNSTLHQNIHDLNNAVTPSICNPSEVKTLIKSSFRVNGEIKQAIDDIVESALRTQQEVRKLQEVIASR